MSAIEQLKAARIAQNATIRGVAKAAGLHENTIHKAEKGHLSPSLGVLEAWAGVLGFEIVVAEVANKIMAEGQQEAV